jgi:hypothetical protein
MKRVIFLLATCLLCGSAALSSQNSDNKQTKKELMAQTIKTQLVDKKFKVRVRWANPLRGQAISLTSDYLLKIKGDSVFSYLPYYGRAYSIPYGGGKALNFNAPIAKYHVTYPKKDRAYITFTTTTDEDTYSYSLYVFMNGNTTINVTSQKRDAISFQGEIIIDL